MIATIINTAAILIGSFIGLLFHSRIRESFKNVVYVGAGIMTLVLGIGMAIKTTRIVYFALSLIIGGILGEWWRIEDSILTLGEFLKRTFAGRKEEDSGKDFAYAFLTASVLFCVGALALVGSFKAGAEGNYDLIFTKSVLDGFMAVILTAALGIGVAFSAASVLVYQGILTVLAVWIKPLVSDVILGEISAVGGSLVLMIGINLLGFAKLKTANYLPSLFLIVLFVALEGLLGKYATF
jgi:uncharacterized membrane protein YqgA involved in biofilm formation